MELVSYFDLDSNHYRLAGDLCAAKYVDNEWYRAKVEKVTGGDVAVLYVDYGNRATLSKAKCAALPGAFTGLPPYAKEYSLALCALANDVSIKSCCSHGTLF
jgi:staphylococcal nuclease domain-containing protein 1